MKKILFTLFGVFLLSTFYFLLSTFSPSPTFAQYGCSETILDWCARTECDTNIGELVCIEVWQAADCSIYEKVGSSTGEACGGCSEQVLDWCIRKECDSNIGQLVCIEKWQAADCSTYEKPGSPTGEPCGVCADHKVADCLWTECDSALGHMVCIDKWQKTDCSYDYRPGTDTGNPCSCSDRKIADCIRTECDTVNFDPGHLVCIDKYERADCSTYEWPGTDTGVICFGAPECIEGETKIECGDRDCSVCPPTNEDCPNSNSVECSSCAGIGTHYTCVGGHWRSDGDICTPDCLHQICTPYSYKYECTWENSAPYGFCDYDHGCFNSPPYDPPYEEAWREQWGWAKLYQCNSCGTAWVFRQEECTEKQTATVERLSCNPPVPEVNPWIFSLQRSISDTVKYLEGEALSGMRDAGVKQEDPNVYGALSALIPAGGPNHELRVDFVKTRAQYDVRLADGSTKKAIEIWNECTGSGDLLNWQNYLSQLDNCPDWGFVPTTYRQLTTEPTPHVQARVGYYLEEDSPLVMTWTEGFFGLFGAILEWFQRFWADHLIYYVCQNGWLWFSGENCPDYDEKKTPQTANLPLQNPATSDETSLKPNIPREASSGAQLLRQFFLPQDFPLGGLPQGNVNCLTVPPPNDWTKCKCTYGQNCDADGDGDASDGQQACWGIESGGACMYDASGDCRVGWFDGELVGCGPCISIGSIDREGCNSYFDLSDPLTNTLLYQTGQTTQYSAVEGGFFQIFHPQGITPTPALCDENDPSPKEDCASKFYYNVTDPKSSELPSGTYYTDTPDEGTYSWTRPEEDRPLKLRTEMLFFKKGIWPAGIPLPGLSP